LVSKSNTRQDREPEEREAGRRRIPMEQALKLCPYGIPLDWIYQGQMANLHPHIREKILEQAPNPRTSALGQPLSNFGLGPPCTRHSNAFREQGNCN
jgi:hypothetical protein